MPSVGLYQRYRLYRRAVRLGSRVATSPRDIARVHRARVQRLQSSIPLVRLSLILVHRHRPIQIGGEIGFSRIRYPVSDEIREIQRTSVPPVIIANKDRDIALSV